MIFNKSGVTLDLEESATGHHVIDLIPGCADLISDDTARENVHGPVRRLRGASVKDSETSAETRKFSNLFCGSEKVTIIDVDKPRVSLVGRGGGGREEILRNLAADGLLEILCVTAVCLWSRMVVTKINRCYCPCCTLVAQSLRKHVMSLWKFDVPHTV